MVDGGVLEWCDLQVCCPLGCVEGHVESLHVPCEAKPQMQQWCLKRHKKTHCPVLLHAIVCI